jgi:hypothetical protein
MSTKSSPQTTTTTSEPPEYLRPFLGAGVQHAFDIYQTGTGGPAVVPFDPLTTQAQQMAVNRAQAGSPVNQAAQNYATKTLGGGFMGANPWLDQAFNKASGAVTNQVQSNFGVSGRNPRGVDAAGFAQEGYNDLAAQIYGGDYQAERARQQQLVPFAGQLANQDYQDISQIANVGAQREALTRQEMDAPNLNIDAYLARLSGMPGSMVTSQIPTERNWLAGAAGGASMGSMFGPWGTLGGGILGGLFG